MTSPIDSTDPHEPGDAPPHRAGRATAGPSLWWTVAVAGGGLVGCALTGAIVGFTMEPPPTLRNISDSQAEVLGIVLFAVVAVVGLLSMFSLCGGLVWLILDGVPRLVRRRAAARDDPAAHGRGRVVLGVLAAGAAVVLLAIAAWVPIEAGGGDVHTVVLFGSGFVACCLGTVAVVSPFLAAAASAVWKKDAAAAAKRKDAVAVE